MVNLYVICALVSVLRRGGLGIVSGDFYSGVERDSKQV